MNSRHDLLFVSIHGAFLTFDPTASAAAKAPDSPHTATAKKGACGQCAACKCKRAFRMG